MTPTASYRIDNVEETKEIGEAEELYVHPQACIMQAHGSLKKQLEREVLNEN